tara:strand:- start:12721 stop:12900 length:180 start_codon:yes stop_codon:yes gene_type:complete
MAKMAVYSAIGHQPNHMDLRSCFSDLLHELVQVQGRSKFVFCYGVIDSRDVLMHHSPGA